MTTRPKTKLNASLKALQTDTQHDVLCEAEVRDFGDWMDDQLREFDKQFRGFAVSRSVGVSSNR